MLSIPQKMKISHRTDFTTEKVQNASESVYNNYLSRKKTKVMMQLVEFLLTENLILGISYLFKHLCQS